VIHLGTNLGFGEALEADATARAELHGEARRRVLVPSVLGSGLGRNKGHGCVQGQSEPMQGPREAGWCCSGSAMAGLHNVRRRSTGNLCSCP